MNPIIQKRYDKAGPRVAAALSRRNMEAFYCPTAIEGVQKVLELIAPEDVVSWGGAMTADEMNSEGVAAPPRPARHRPRHRRHPLPSGRELMRKALTCDTFLMSSNAISEDGQLVNIDGNGNRVAALCFGPRRVIVVAGMNKVVGTLDDAIARAPYRRARESPALRRQDSLQHDRLLRRLRQPPVQLRADRRHTLFHEPQPHQGRSGGRKSRPVRHKKEESALKTLLLRPRYRSAGHPDGRRHSPPRRARRHPDGRRSTVWVRTPSTVRPCGTSLRPRAVRRTTPHHPCAGRLVARAVLP